MRPSVLQDRIHGSRMCMNFTLAYSSRAWLYRTTTRFLVGFASGQEPVRPVTIPHIIPNVHVADPVTETIQKWPGFARGEHIGKVSAERRGGIPAEWTLNAEQGD